VLVSCVRIYVFIFYIYMLGCHIQFRWFFVCLPCLIVLFVLRHVTVLVIIDILVCLLLLLVVNAYGTRV